ncbi:MAG: hypothetical protein JW952_00990 [Candidatus Eisenbacteria bacterium]|nr:hypothetical protein [Candidatus Eisenbacteria bacterium]
MRRDSVTRARVASVCGLTVFLLWTGLAGKGHCRETSFWLTESDADFRGGTPEHVSVNRPGVVVLAPELDTLLSSEDDYFWCLADDGRGTVYAGSGDAGRVYSVDERGKSEVVADSLDLEVLSLAVDAGGAVYAGTAPGGLIWKIAPGGKRSVFFETGETYVWCLVFDDDGNLYAGTGDKGNIYKISPDGKGEVFYQTGERHVMCARHADGRLVVGTEGTGLVFAVNPQGKGRVLYDCDEQEVRDLACADGGVVYAAAVARTKGMAGPELGGAPASGRDHGEQMSGSSLYRIAADGTTSRLWASSRSTIYCVWPVSADSILLGTGDEGRILCLGSGRLGLVDAVEQSQVLDLMESSGRLVFSTGNEARVFSSGPGTSRSGTLVSRAFDTNGVSRWGGLSWEAEVPRGASVTFQLRTGNSETPNRTWSDWSEGVRENGAVPQSPPARFVQWKATLGSGAGGSSPSLTKVTLAFAERNLPPTVDGLKVLPQGMPFVSGGIEKMPERVSQTLPGGIKVEYSAVRDATARAVEGAAWARTVRTAVWEAADPNGDNQKFAVYYKRLEETRWKPIEEDVRETLFAWNTSAWPDGSYCLRVVATDLPDNLPEEALSAETVSLPFDVDNTAPVVSRLASTRVTGGAAVTGTLSDSMSPVTELHYSLDGGDWMPAQASDGLLDSRTEDFSILLSSLEAGEHTVGVRAIDGAGNVGSGSVLIRR